MRLTAATTLPHLHVTAFPDATGAFRRAVGCAFTVLRERDPERQRALIAFDTSVLLDASVVREFAPTPVGGWRLTGDQTTALPPLAEQMETELLPRALAAGQSLVSSHPNLDPTLARLARACRKARITTHMLVLRSDQKIFGTLAVHWIGRERPPLEYRVAFYYYWDTVGLAVAVAEERQRVEAELARLGRRAFSDTLTGLPNTLALEDELQRHADTYPFAAIALDFDGMREANTAFGYTAGGDVLIRLVGRALAQLAHTDEFVARLYTAGDEFALLLPGANAMTAEARAGQIEAALDALEAPETHRNLYHGASVGYASRQGDDTPGQTLGNAIESMRKRKLERRSD
jgi:diguanylate cyclase (GGDEF)-like protein